MAKLTALTTGCRAPVACGLILAALFLGLFAPRVCAQHFTFSLDDISHLFVDNPLDSVPREPLSKLRLGPYHRVPNFLDSDFSRVRETSEFSLDGTLWIRFRSPMIYPFTVRESRDGVFFMLEPRSLDTPGLEIEIESIDAMAQRRAREAFRETWRTEIVRSINQGKEGEATQKGLLSIAVPVDLPDPVERIIGSGEATNIDISGRESITFSGESRIVDPFIGVEGQQKQSLFPSLDLRQELDVRLQGQIGQKINVQVDHSSSSMVENQNRIRLNYQGFEDDVVQLIEMGNTSLTLPGSQLVSFSGQSQGLFGIKALAQAGPVDLTVIASKEEGQASRATFTPQGGVIGQTEQRFIRDIDYVRDVYFFLDEPFIPGRFFRPNERDIEIFQSVPPQERQIRQATEGLVTFPGKAWVDTLGRGQDIRQALDLVSQGRQPAPFESGDFELLVAGEDYRFVLDAQTEDVIGVELFRAVPNAKVLAIRYINELGDTIGDYRRFPATPTDTLALELLKPRDARPTNQFGYVWSYMMRNIYNLGLSNLDLTTFRLEILDNTLRLDPSIPEGSEVPWIRVFGLDQTDEAGTGPPDNRVDLRTGLIDPVRGILTFPILTPFNPPDPQVAIWTDSLFAFPGSIYEDYRKPEIYTAYLTRPEDYQRWVIAVEASSTSRTFQINAFDITPGSEVIRLDGRQLQRGRDYTIDYETGEVELQGDVLTDLTPSSNITIDYEFTPFAGGASSTLMGINSMINLSPNSKIGTTWLYESKTSSGERPRLGEEPTRAIVGDVNANLQYDWDFLTDVVNVLPLVDTDARSSVNLSAEVAMSIPDPNTAGEVYIDDFEGVEDSDVFSLIRRSWNDASPPIDPVDKATALDPDKRENIFWYNIEPDRGVTRRDLNPDLDERESTLVPSIDIELVTLDFDTVAEDTTRWLGIMTGFGGGGLDLSQGQFIEIWVNDFKRNVPGLEAPPQGGILRIDMGQIDEDFYRPKENIFNTEDANFDGFNALTEDTGLDGIANPGGDPDDDYSPARDPATSRFLYVNGTEGNRLLDLEDLDGNTQLDQFNSYYTFELDLSDTAIVDVAKEFPGSDRFNNPYHQRDSWRLYRIPLVNADRITRDGEPAFEQIKHLRIWFDHIGDVMHPGVRRFQIAGFKVVGNRWERDGIRTVADSLLTEPATGGGAVALGVISTKTDPTKYIPPMRPNERDDIFEKEQSLLVAYKDIQPDQGFRIRKRFAGRGLDWTNYRDLNFFVHVDQFNASLEYYFQVAFDSLNFYEISMPVTQEYFPARGWGQCFVSLTDITDLKFLPPDSIVTTQLRDLRDESKVYKVRMVGNPNLFNVRFFYAGLRNRDVVPVQGELWLNDIYLGNRKRDIDFAQRASATINMANVISFNASWRRVGPDFRGLRQSRGTGADNRSLALSLKTNLNYFVPLFGFNIPVTGNYSENVSLPKFSPNSDTEITDPAIQDSVKTVGTTRGFGTTVTKSGSKNPIFRWTLDKTRTNFSLSETRQSSPSSTDTTLSMSGTLDYQINFGQKPRVRVLKDIYFRYFMNSLNFRLAANRRTGRRWRNLAGRIVPDPPLYSASLDGSGGFTYIPFPSLTTSFRASQRRDLALPKHLGRIDVGTEVARNHGLQVNYKVPALWILRELQPDFNYGSGYREDLSPNVQRPGDPEGVRNASSSRDVSVKTSIQLGTYFNRLFSALGIVERDKRAPGRGGGGGTREGEASADSTSGKPRDTMAAPRFLARVLSNIRKVSTSIRQQAQSDYSRIPERPSLAYQFGLTDDAGVLTADGMPIDPERTTRSLSVTMDSGVQVTNDIDVAGRFTNTVSRAEFRAADTRTTARTWPDVNLSWKGLERFGPFRGLFKATSFTMGWRQTLREVGRGGDVDTEDTNRSLTPSLVFTWRNNISSSLNMSFTSNRSDTRGSVNETSLKNFSLDMKYTFVPGKKIRIPLPFLRNKALSSNLDTSLGIGYTTTDGRRYAPGSVFPEPLPGTNTIRVSPRLTYNFSRTLNGSFFIDYNRRYTDATNQTTTTVQVGINAIFTF